MTRTRANILRKLIEKLSKSLEDEEASIAVELFPSWKRNQNYIAGDRVRYGETLYKCISAHTSQESWTPEAASSLWARTDDPADECPEWVQPIGASDSYPMGSQVSHNGKHWNSDYDNNVWEPGTFGWHEVV